MAKDRVYEFSAPGRVEIGGNHTDHQHGRVLAAAIDLTTNASVCKNDDEVIRVFSQGYDPVEVYIHGLELHEAEKNTTVALVLGVSAAFVQRGCPIGGFDARISSTVLPGSGLSSSAAFEVLIGNIANHLFAGGAETPVTIAQIGQYAENVFFGKPSGLLDQMASSVGGVVAMDFADPAAPVVQPLSLDLAGQGYALCIVDTGADHADLTGEYAAIPAEMKAVAAALGGQVLRDVPKEAFYKALPALRKELGDRALLRAFHFYADDERAALQAQALAAGEFDRYLRLVRESGESSFDYLQNVFCRSKPVEEQPVALALALAGTLLAGQGAYRVHGGGFAGTIQAYVPLDFVPDFKAGMEALLGEGMCHVVSIRPVGGLHLTEND